MADDFLPIKGYDHVEFYVGNALQAAYVYEHAFGFTRVAYAGPETGLRDRASYVMRQARITVVLTAPMTKDGPIAHHVAKHGDGVRDVALGVDDVEGTFSDAVTRGAIAVSKPDTVKDEHGTIVRAQVASYGDTVHTLIDRSQYTGVHLPGYKATGNKLGRGVGLTHLDHAVGNVEIGKMDRWVDYYKHAFGFQDFVSFDEKDISTDYSALRSKVVANADLKVKLPINEPAAGKKRSQIQEYLDFYPGPGVQHLAIRTDDILATIAEMRRRGVDFLHTPDSYYDDLKRRVPAMTEAVEDLRKLRILADRDEHGYLLQLFTKPIQDRPTLFFEIIQRKGAESFGKGNFKALFESIEREQAKRGNL